jgi:FkbM family methyltransferase
MPFHSQYKQDEFLEETIFKGFRDGFFVDVGAHDGISINNTLFFEKERGWKGINVEPIPEVYARLSDNRPACCNINCAVSETNGTAEFIQNCGYSEMISGLKEHYDPRHSARLSRELAAHGGETRTITVPTRRLDDIITEHGVAHVHYLSIDVEGAEFSVIKSIDFSSVFIDVIGFENNYQDSASPIVRYLFEKGYKLLPHRSADIFMIHTDSKFCPSP